jgi:hypothetical protein
MVTILPGEVERRRAFYSSQNPLLHNVSSSVRYEDSVTRRAVKFYTENEKMSLRLLLSEK